MMTTGERVVAGVVCGLLALGLYVAAVVSVWSSTGVWRTNLGEIISGLQGHGVTLFFWVILVVTFAVVVGLLVLVAKFDLGGPGSSSERAGRKHMVTYASVSRSLGRTAAVRAARQKNKQLLPPVASDPAESKRQIAEFVDGMPDNWLVTELGKLGGRVTKKNGQAVFKGGRPIYGEAKESKLVLAPTQAGKTTSIASNLVLDAPGAVMATSTKPDLLMITAAARQRVAGAAGEVLVYDLHDVSGWPHRVMWNPVVGCEDFETAQRRAQAWAHARPVEGTKNGSWFNEQAAAFLARFLHVAAVAGKSLDDIMKWAQDLRSRVPLELAQDHSYQVPDHVIAFLDSKQENRAGETLDSIQQTLAGMLEPLAVDRIREQFVCDPIQAFDMKKFLSGPNTIYLIADTAHGVDVGPLVSMFANELINTAREVSQERPGGRLWPCFRAVLDEGPNLAAFPKMDSIMSDINGRGIEVILIAQSFSQLIDRWGEQGAATITGNAAAKYYLPGLDLKTLQPLAESLGKYQRGRVSRSYSAGQYGNSTSYSQEEKLVMEAHQMQQIPAFSAIVQYKNYRPMHLGLTPWWEREDMPQLKDDQLYTYRVCGKTPDETQDLKAWATGGVVS